MMRVIMDQALAVGIRKRRPLLAGTILAMFAGIMPAAAQSDLCKPGYLWRRAFADDHVCVTPDVRAQAAADNEAAVRRRAPGGGDTCVSGYVWRLASPQDHVCVTQQTASDTQRDNNIATSRLASPTPPAAFADERGTQPLITRPIVEDNLAVLSGNTRPEAREPANDRGIVSDGLPLEHMMLQLQQSRAVADQDKRMPSAFFSDRSTSAVGCVRKLKLAWKCRTSGEVLAAPKWRA
jgi:hypothetical protein